VGNHVLHEPHVGLVVDDRLVHGGRGTACRQHRENNPVSEPSSHPCPLAVAFLPLCRLVTMSARRRFA
jgi:hypothetical protein